MRKIISKERTGRCNELCDAVVWALEEELAMTVKIVSGVTRSGIANTLLMHSFSGSKNLRFDDQIESFPTSSQALVLAR